jgi:hypothetical protein
MIARRYRIRHKIEELKKKIDWEERASLSI